MMHKLIYVAAVPVLALGAIVAGAWYTGTQVEVEINKALVETNEKLLNDFPDSAPYLKLISIERGVFRTHSRYQASFTLTKGEPAHQIVISEALEHGPFPLSLLRQGQIRPVMAASTQTLERNKATQTIFEAAGNQSPLTGRSVMQYDRSVTGTLDSAALHFRNAKSQLTVSPAQMQVSISADKKAISFQGTLADLTLDLHQDENLQGVLLKGLSVSLDKTENANGFALGESAISAQQISVKRTGDGPVEVYDSKLHERLQQGSNGLDQSLTYHLGKIVAAERDFGAFNLDVGISHINEEVLLEIEQALIGYGNSEDPDLNAQQERHLEQLFLKLLSQGLHIELKDLSLTTANGKAQAQARVDLQKPRPDAQDTAEKLRSALALAELNMTLDKALIAELSELSSQAQQLTNAQQLKQYADARGELISGVLLNNQWATLQGNSLNAQLRYANDQITLNQKTMSLERFAGFAFSSLLGMQMQLAVLHPDE